MPSSTIIDSRLLIRQNIDQIWQANASALMNNALKAHLARQILLYETIVILTNDFGIIPILVSWVGIEKFYEALTKGCLRFIHFDLLLSYMGGERGLALQRVKESDTFKFKWWQETFFGVPDNAIQLQLQYACLELNDDQRDSLYELVLANSLFVNLTDIFDTVIKDRQGFIHVS